MKEKSRQGMSAGIIWTVTFCLFLFLGYKSMLYYFSLQRRSHMKNLDECYRNCEELAAAIQLYSDDNDGKLPNKIIQLYPKYIDKIPECPGAGYDTYSESYQVSGDNFSFTLFCKGHHHREIGNPENYPRFSSSQGLCMKPGY